MNLLLVFLIAVVNLALGYALARKFGWELIGRTPPSTVEAAQHWHDEHDDDPLPPEKPVEAVIEVAESAFDPSPVVGEPAAAAPPPRDKCFLELTLDGFFHRLADFAENLVRCGVKVRDWGDSPDPQQMEQLRTELMANVEVYRAVQQDGNNLLKDERDELGDLTAVGDRLESAVDDHCELIDAVQHRIDNQAVQADTLDDCGLLAEEIGCMLASCHLLRDLLQAGLLDIARHENRIATSTDELTGLPDRAGLEVALATCWRDEEHQDAVYFALMDMNGFQNVNRKYGPQVGDRVLRAAADALGNAARECVVGRIAGQRFALVLPSADRQAAADVIERCRQTIELARIQCEGHDIRLTASCVLLVAAADDTPQTLMRRAEDLSDQTKLQGVSRTVLCEDSEREPLEPLDLGIEETVLSA